MKTPRHAVAAALTQRSLQHTGVAVDNKQLAGEIAAFLLAERRTGEFDSLLRDMVQNRADAGVVEVTAVSAYPLTETVDEDIRTQVLALYPTATEIIISHRHDDTVVAGVKLVFANQQLDLSIRNKLNRLKQLTGSPNAAKPESTRKET